MSSEVKVCRVCGCVLIVGDNWYASRAKINSKICKSCNQIEAKKYTNQKNRLEWSRKYYTENKSKINARRREWGLKNRNRKLKQSPVVFVTSSCKHCGTPLICGENWYISRCEKQEYICKDCSKKQLINNFTPRPSPRTTNTKKEFKTFDTEYFKNKRAEFRLNDPERYKAFCKHHYKKQRHRKIEAYIKYRQEREALHTLLVITT